MRFRFSLRGINNVNTTEGVIWQKIVFFALPILLTNFLQQLYNTIDMIIVGNFSTQTALTAVGSTGPLTNLLVGFFLGLSTGSSVLVAQHYGGQDYRSLYRTVHSSLFIGLLNGALLTIMGLFASGPMLTLMNTPIELMPEATLYMKVIFLGMIPTSVYNMVSSILRAVGDSRRPLLFLIISAVTNLVLDLLFVAVLDMGVLGAAIATVIAQTLSAVLGVITLVRSDTPYRLFLKEIRPWKKEVRQILQIGVPAGLQSAVISTANATIQAEINKYGFVVAEGYAAEGRINGFFYMTVNSFSLALTTFVGQNIGAKKYERVKQGVKTALAIATVLCLLLGVIVFFTQWEILKLFNVSSESMEYAIKMLTITCFLYSLFGIGDILSGAFRGAGKAFAPMISALINMFVIRLLWVFIAQQVQPGAMTVYWAFPVSWLTMAISMGIYYFRGNWLPKPVEEIDIDTSEA